MLSFTSRYPAALSILVIAAAFLLSYYSYKKITLSRKKRYVLIAVRTAALFLVLALFIEPSLTAVVGDSREDVDVALIDNSRSIRLPGQDPEQIRGLLNRAGLDNDNLIVFSFSRAGVQLPKIISADSLNFGGFETDLAYTLKALKDAVPGSRINSITVVSDGNFNTGGSPLYTARTFQCPVNSILTGDSVQRKDIVIKSVLYTEKSFTDTDTRLRVNLRAYGFKNESFPVILQREGYASSSRNVVISEDREDATLDFTVRENRPGTIKYKISAGQMAGELTYWNNEKDLLIEYFDDRKNLLFVSSGPGYDNSLFTESLKKIRNYSVTFRTQKSPEEFYEGPVDPKTFGDLSAVILFGFPSDRTGSELISGIAEKSSVFSIPLVFFASRNTDYKKLARFEQIPFSISRPGTVETYTTPRLVSSEGIFSKEFSSAVISSPQLLINQSGIIPGSGSTVLMTGGPLAEPVLITLNTTKARSAAFLCYGLWRWRLNPAKNNEEFFLELLQTTVNQTIRREKRTKLNISAGKDVFDYTENATITAEVFDDNMAPLINAVVKARVISRNNGSKQEILLTPDDKKYSAVVPGLITGDYSVEAEAELNGNFYAIDSCRFLVDTIRTEYLETKNSREALEELSSWTGGKTFYLTPDMSLFEAVSSSTVTSKTELTVTRRYNLWENKFLLAAIFILFTAEWVIKKRNNIP